MNASAAPQDLSDELFLHTLEKHRGRGRNDYPIHLLWKSVISSIAWRVESIEEMRRKMQSFRDTFPKVPTAFAFSRFFSFLCRFSSDIEELLLRQIERSSSEFGQVLAVANFDQIHFLWEPRFSVPILFQSMEGAQSFEDIATQLIDRLKKLNPSLFVVVSILLPMNATLVWLKECGIAIVYARSFRFPKKVWPFTHTAMCFTMNRGQSIAKKESDRWSIRDLRQSETHLNIVAWHATTALSAKSIRVVLHDREFEFPFLSMRESLHPFRAPAIGGGNYFLSISPTIRCERLYKPISHSRITLKRKFSVVSWPLFCFITRE